MLVIDNLFLEDGTVYPRVFFDGDKDDLLDAIECDAMVTFTHTLEGRTKEVTIRADFIISYETEVSPEQDSEDRFDGVKVIMFPTAGFKDAPKESVDDELLQQMLKDNVGSPKKSPKK